MSTLKQNPLTNLVKAAVGLPTTASRCCGVPAAAVTSSTVPAQSESVEPETAGDCGCDKASASVANPPEGEGSNAAPSCCG